MERHARFGLVAFLAVIVLCLPAFSECGNWPRPVTVAQARVWERHEAEKAIFTLTFKDMDLENLYTSPLVKISLEFRAIRLRFPDYGISRHSQSILLLQAGLLD